MVSSADFIFCISLLVSHPFPQFLERWLAAVDEYSYAVYLAGGPCDDDECAYEQSQREEYLPCGYVIRYARHH